MRWIGTGGALDDREPLIALVDVPLCCKQRRIIILINFLVASWVCSILQELGALVICCWYIMELLAKEMLRLLLLCWSVWLPVGVSYAALLLVRKVFALSLHVGSPISSKKGLWLRRRTKFTN